MFSLVAGAQTALIWAYLLTGRLITGAGRALTITVFCLLPWWPEQRLASCRRQTKMTGLHFLSETHPSPLHPTPHLHSPPPPTLLPMALFPHSLPVSILSRMSLGEMQAAPDVQGTWTRVHSGVECSVGILSSPLPHTQRVGVDERSC